MERCHKCGYQISDGMRFCSFCGCKVKIKSQFQREPLVPVVKTSVFKVLSAVCTISGIFGILTYLCHLAVLQQRTRSSQYISEWDEYMIYLLAGSIIVTIVGLIGLSIKHR